MADYIRPTPRNPILGLLADALTGGVDWMRDPRRAQQMQGLGGLLAETGIPATVERLSYGEPLTTGRGMTTRLRPEAEAALLTLSPAPQATSRAAMAAGRAGERMAERVVPQVMERGGRGAGLLEALSARTVSPLTVYHGSPHKFEKFDASKIGTGEGAQAYGYGHYVAESPGVATSYKNLVQRDPNRLMVDGKVVSPDTMYGRAAEDVARIGLKATLKKIDDNIQFNEKYAPDMAAMYRDLRKKIEALEPTKVTLKEGNLYTIDLPDSAIARMLNWDKPLSEQSDYIKRIIKENELDYVPEKFTGGRLLEEMNKAFDPEIVSKHLRQAGIPGIRYLDQGSRGVGQGTSNFVVFPGEEGLLRILKRNEDPLGLFAP